LLIAGCGPQTAASTTCASDSTPAAYGCGPATDGSVTYQPGVVLVRGGSAAVRSVSADGLTWTLRGDAPGAADLQPGRVMYVTGIGVGRVLAVSRAGSDRAVTVGPVDLTDVFHDAHFSTRQPVSFNNPVAYSVPGAVGANAAIAEDMEPASDVSRASRAVALPPIRLVATPIQAPSLPGGAPSSVPSGLPKAIPAPPSLPPASRLLTQVAAGAYRLAPKCCAGGLGVDFAYDRGGLRLVGSAAVHAATPRVEADLRIGGGRIVLAQLSISGGGGISLWFQAAAYELLRNINEVVEVPVDLTLPIPGTPLTASVTHWFVFKTAFSAKRETLNASGDYSFGGTLGFGWSNGAFRVVSQPQNFSKRQSFAQSITGLTFSVNSMVISHQVRFSVGIGLLGFRVGLQFWLTSTLGITQAPAIADVPCKAATIDESIRYGLGWSVPGVVADAVNFFLRALHVRQIRREGSVWAPSKNVYHDAGFVPDIPGCHVS
jgi:hypothetical protein